MTCIYPRSCTWTCDTHVWPFSTAVYMKHPNRIYCRSRTWSSHIPTAFLYSQRLEAPCRICPDMQKFWSPHHLYLSWCFFVSGFRISRGLIFTSVHQTVKKTRKKLDIGYADLLIGYRVRGRPSCPVPRYWISPDMDLQRISYVYLICISSVYLWYEDILYRYIIYRYPLRISCLDISFAYTDILRIWGYRISKRPRPSEQDYEWTEPVFGWTCSLGAPNLTCDFKILHIL